MVFRRRRLKRPISIAKSVYGYIRTKVTAGRHFRTDLSVQKSERVNRLKSHNLYVLADDRSILIFLISSPSCNTRDRNMQEVT